MDTQQEADRELVVLEAWRARLCARGLRDAYDRMRRAMLGGQLELSQALQIAGAMDAAMDMLRTTTKRLAPGTELRAAAEDVLSAFVEWRVASPRSDASRRASARFGARVLALEELATKASRPDADGSSPEGAKTPGGEPAAAPAQGGTASRAVERSTPRADGASAAPPDAWGEREPTSSTPVITIEETTLEDLDAILEEEAAVEAPRAAAPEPEPPRVPRERSRSGTPGPQRKRGRSSPRDRA